MELDLKRTVVYIDLPAFTMLSDLKNGLSFMTCLLN